MVVYSGLKCRKCGTRVALAVTPNGRAFACPTCQAPMRARRRVTMHTAMVWCPRCWVTPRELDTHACPKCGQSLEPLRLTITPEPRQAVHG